MLRRKRSLDKTGGPFDNYFRFLRSVHMKLIIVESPHKCDTIARFLGPDYKVLASKGHIRDLSYKGKMGLGVDVEHNFEPNYEIDSGKEDVVKQLKSAVAKADEVYLATDPDREGEAISWHLAQVLNLDANTTKRLEFHEVTKPAVSNALNNPRTIDIQLVESQETRRIIDRIMGFRLSNLLQKKIRSRSAGRVQSVVLKFVVDRENEISSFVPEEYWSIDVILDADGSSVTASFAGKNGKTVKITSADEANAIVNALPSQFRITNIKKENRKREPKPPFITSTLQQEAFSQLHFSTKKTAAVAQKLYEGVEINGVPTGLITYMRTDSVRLSDVFKASAASYITETYGKNYLGRAHTQKSSKNVQDAHEAIRPTDINLTPAKIEHYLSSDEYQLYKLIYERAVASLMAAKVDEVTTVSFDADGYEFTASGTTPVFDGYSKIYGVYEEKEDKIKLPSLSEGQVCEKGKVTPAQHFTKAPQRYNEGKLVKAMQENGIGRPSTYASTISNLLDHKYIKTVKGSLVPTEQGILTVEKLNEYFSKYMDVKYTAEMETELDNIADGSVDEKQLLAEFWEGFQNLYTNAEVRMEKKPLEEIGENCPMCGAPLVIREGKYGPFISCSNFPTCRYIKKEESESLEGHVCPDCGGKLVKRVSKKGEFYGCSNYPKCKYMEDTDGKRISTEKKEIVIPSDAPICPKCHVGHLVEKKSRYGKSFIGCSNYPKCNYTVTGSSRKSK